MAETRTSLQHSTQDSTINRYEFQFQKKSTEAPTEAGWKSDIEKHIFLSGAKRPEGVIIWREKGICKRVLCAIVRTHLDSRRFEGVFWWKHQNAVIFSSFEG